MMTRTPLFIPRYSHPGCQRSPRSLQLNRDHQEQQVSFYKTGEDSKCVGMFLSIPMSDGQQSMS